jgi:hypothetical protein
VVAPSALGLALSGGTTLGTSGTVVTSYRRWTANTPWQQVHGRAATAADHYQEMRWNLRDTASRVGFSVQIRAYDSGVALRYVLLDSGTATIMNGICYGQSRDLTTNAHQMAMAVVYYQPLAFLSWYGTPSKYATAANWPGLPWFDAVPTTWDETPPAR